MRTLALLLVLALAPEGLMAQGAGRIVRYDFSKEKQYKVIVVALNEIQLGSPFLELETLLDGVTHVTTLGPPEFVKVRKMDFRKGEILLVKGIIMGRADNGNILSIRELSRGETTWTLKDARGESLW